MKNKLNNKNIGEKVEDYLDDVQKNKKFSVDIGVDKDNKRVNFSQKKIIAFNKLSNDEFKKEINDLSNADKLKMYNLSKFINDYDFDIDVQKGIDGGALFIKKEIIDNLGKGIGKKPGIKGLKNDQINGLLEIYPKALEFFIPLFYNIENFEDINNINDYIRREFINETRELCYGSYLNKKNNQFIKADAYYNLKNKEDYQFINLERILGKKSIGILRNMYSMKFKGHDGRYYEKSFHNYAKFMFSKTTQEGIDKDYNNYFNQITKVVERNKGKGADPRKESYFYTKDEYIKNHGLFIQENDYSFIEGKEKKQNQKLNSAGNIDKEILNYGQSNYSKFSHLNENYIRKGFSSKLDVNSFNNINELKDILFNQYGINRLNFGNTIKDDLAKEKTFQVLESLDDLHEVLGLDIKKINKLHDLSLGFAVASGLGKKGGGIAHYDSSQKFINFSKNGLNGNFAHEYFHFIDNFLFNISGFEEEVTRDGKYIKYFSSLMKYKNKFKFDKDSLDLLNIVENIYNIMLKGVNNNKPTIIYKPNLRKKTQYLFSQRLIKNYKSKGLSINEMKKEFELALQQKFIKKEGNNRYNENIIKNQELLAIDFITSIYKEYKEEALKYIKSNGKEGISPKEINQFELKSNAHEYSELFSNCMYLDKLKGGKKEYYTSEIELFARSFESYLFHKFNNLNLTNSFLIQSTYKGDIAYPQGEELIKINDGFDKLINKINDIVSKK